MDRELRELHQGALAEQRALIPDPDPTPEPEPARSERTQVDLEGEALPPVPRLSCEGRAGARHDTVTMSITRATPLELWCPRCDTRISVEEIDR